MEDSFSNSPMDLDDLPSVAAMELQPVSPHYPKIAVMQSSLAVVPPLLIMIAMLAMIFYINPERLEQFSPGDILLEAGLPVLLLCLVIVVVVYKEAKTKTYCLREHDLIFHYGLLTKRTVVQPLLRVQHLEVSQNPLEAKWGLASLKLFSAGGFRHTFAIPGLTKEQAEKLRQRVVDYQEAHHE